MHGHLIQCKGGYRIQVYNPHTRKMEYIAQRKKLEDIMDIHRECVEAKWDHNTLLEIKEKHKKYKKWNNPEKHICYKQGKYTVFIQNIRKGTNYCGRYDTLEEAINIRDELLKGNMDVLNLKPHVPHIKRYSTRHIYPVQGNENKYIIQKTINGKSVYFGTFYSLDDAICERDFLEAHDWDSNCYDLV